MWDDSFFSIFVLTACSNAKTCWLKKYWSCSLAIFMHSCSNELYLKFSKPKISNIPITLYSPLKNTSPTRRNWLSNAFQKKKTKRIYHLVVWKDNKLLMELTSQSNSRLYNARAMASLVAMASDTELFLWMISPLVTTLFTLKHSNRSELSMSNRHEAKKERRRHEMNPVHSYTRVIGIDKLLLWIGVRSITVLLLSVLLSVMISPNSMSPKCNMAARMQYMELTSSSLKPTCSKAFFSWANLSTLVWKQNDDMHRV